MICPCPDLQGLSRFFLWLSDLRTNVTFGWSLEAGRIVSGLDIYGVWQADPASCLRDSQSSSSSSQLMSKKQSSKPFVSSPYWRQSSISPVNAISFCHLWQISVRASLKQNSAVTSKRFQTYILKGTVAMGALIIGFSPCMAASGSYHQYLGHSQARFALYYRNCHNNHPTTRSNFTRQVGQ